VYLTEIYSDIEQFQNVAQISTYIGVWCAMSATGLIEPYLDSQFITMCYILTPFFNYLSDNRKCITSFFVFAKLRKSTFSFFMSVRL